MDGGLDAAERALVERIADRREEIVALTRELIGFDTTSRAGIDEPAREEAALQQALADPDLYSRDPERFNAAGSALAAARAELTEAEDQWLTLEMLREEIEGG